ncbi:KGK domain protein [Pleurocapsales cyanobacterium LEGE 10410]|nr:KGK domain protein [Pleurocapsales cyanobacterium LEGE 10410]
MMKFNNYLEQCQDDDVLCHKTDLFKVGKIKDAIITAFATVIPNKLQEELSRQKIHIQPTKLVGEGRKSRLTYDNNIWFKEGVNFQVLKAGSKGWQKGKLKINLTLEFIPDEPEEEKSPLDDVRKELEQNNS